MNSRYAMALGFLAGAVMLAPSMVLATSVLTTGAGYKGVNQGFLFCIGTNVGNKPVATMTVSLIDLSGNVLNSDTCAPVNPGEVCQTDTTFPSHCRIEFKGPRKSVRGSLSVNSAVGNNIEIIEPAR